MFTSKIDFPSGTYSNMKLLFEAFDSRIELEPQIYTINSFKINFILMNLALSIHSKSNTQ